VLTVFYWILVAKYNIWISLHKSRDTVLFKIISSEKSDFNTLRTGDADLRLYITTVQEGW
jgi:hypothetical protein